MLPQGPCWTKPISYPAWAGGCALRAGQGTMGKWMWTNQFPNYFPLLPPPTRGGKGRGQRGKGMVGPELQLPLRRENGLSRRPPFTFSPLPRHHLEAGWRLAEILLSLWLPLRGRRLWRVKNRGAQAPGFILTPAKKFGFLKNNHNSWVKNQFVTKHQPQSEPPQGGDWGSRQGTAALSLVVPLTL